MKLKRKMKGAGRFHLLTTAVFLIVLSVWSPVFAGEAENPEPIETMEAEFEIKAPAPTSSLIEVEIVETEIEAVFDDVISAENGYIIVSKDDKLGLLDIDGQVVMPCQYDYDFDNLAMLSQYSFFKENDISFMLKADRKYGIHSSMGEPISPFKYDRYLENYENAKYYKDSYVIYPFNDSGIAIVQEKGKGWGVVNAKGEELVEPQYSSIKEFVNGRAVVDRFDLYGFIDENGQEIISCQYDKVSSYSNGYAAVEIKGRYGYIDENGVLVIPAVYNYAGGFNSDGLAVVFLDEKASFIDSSGRIKFSLPEGVQPVYYYYETAVEFQNGLLPVEKYAEDPDEDYYWGWRYGYIDEDGNVALPFEYDEARPFEDGLAIVSKNSRCGVIDVNGNEILDLKYDHIWKTLDGFQAIDEYGTYAHDFNGELLSQGWPQEYEKASYWPEIYFGVAGYYVSHEGKDGFLNEDGELLIPLDYDSVRPQNEEFALVYRGILYGLYNMKLGKEVVPCEYDYIAVDQSSDEIPVVQVHYDDKIGVFSIEGDVLIPVIYKAILPLNDSSIAVVLGEDNLYRFIDINGQITIAGEFQSASPFIDNKALVQKPDGKWYTFELLQDTVEIAEID